MDDSLAAPRDSRGLRHQPPAVAELARLKAHHARLSFELTEVKAEARKAMEIFARKLEALIRATERINEQMLRLQHEVTEVERDRAVSEHAAESVRLSMEQLREGR